MDHQMYLFYLLLDIYVNSFHCDKGHIFHKKLCSYIKEINLCERGMNYNGNRCESIDNFRIDCRAEQVDLH